MTTTTLAYARSHTAAYVSDKIAGLMKRLVTPLLPRVAYERKEDIDILERLGFCVSRVRAGQKVAFDVKDGFDFVAHLLVPTLGVLRLGRAEL